MKYNKGFAPLIIFLIVLGVGIVGAGAYYVGVNKNAQKQGEFLKIEDSSVVKEDLKESVEVKNSVSNSDVIKEWKSFKTDELQKIALAENIFLEKESGIGLSETVDLTGDGLDEAIFVGNGGNNNLGFIMTKNSDGTNSVLKNKEREGMIYPVLLLSVGRVRVNEQYKLLPAEHGFYTSSMSYDEKADKFTCNQNGVNAYSWSIKTKIFEWNKTLTDKYTKEVCK